MKLSETLRERGYVYQFSAEKLEDIVDGPKRILYHGVDPTADSMHVGQLMGMMVLRRFVEAGHELILLIGDGTGMVGDPGGKSADRNLLEPEVVMQNGLKLKSQFEKLLGDVPLKAMVHNSEWLSQVNYMEFLRDIGKHFTVNEMIKRDTIRPRLETPDQSISYTEFSYMLLQAYDYLELHKRYDCDLQVGGSDQWGNMIPGIDLIRRKTGDQAYVFSWPLVIDKKTGKKFGKSEGNAIWLDPLKTSPFQFYQFWLNAEDDAMEEYLLKMTLLTKEGIDVLMHRHKLNPGERAAQKKLATEVTTLVHGSEVTQHIKDASEVLFGDADITLLDTDGLFQLTYWSSVPLCEVRVGESILDVVVRAGLASSKREARQFIADGAITLNKKKPDESMNFSESDFIHKESFHIGVLKRGKRHVSVLVLK